MKHQPEQMAPEVGCNYDEEIVINLWTCYTHTHYNHTDFFCSTKPEA